MPRIKASGRDTPSIPIQTAAFHFTNTRKRVQQNRKLFTFTATLQLNAAQVDGAPLLDCLLQIRNHFTLSRRKGYSSAPAIGAEAFRLASKVKQGHNHQVDHHLTGMCS